MTKTELNDPPDSQSTTGGPFRSRNICRAVLVVAVSLTFCQACRYDFVNFDDEANLPQNPLMNPPTAHSLKVWWTEPTFELYDPLTITIQGGIALLARVSPDPDSGVSLNPWIFHTFNILLHVAVTLLVYQLLLDLKLSSSSALAGSLLFGIHPVQVEPVVWITSIKDLLFTLFGLIAIGQLLVWVHATSQAKCRTVGVHGNLVLATLCFVLALLSKPTAVVLPIVAIPLLWIRCGRVPARAWYSLASWTLLAIPVVVIASSSQPVHLEMAGPLWIRPLIAGDAITFYLWKILWPRTLMIFYGRTPGYVIQHGFIWWTPVLSTALAAALWLNRRSAAPLLAGFCVLVAGLLPVLRLLNFKFQLISTVGDRYLYLPMFGVAIMAAWGLDHLPRPCSFFAVLLLSCLAARSAVQTRTWQNSLTLFEHVLDNNPKNALANFDVAVLLSRQRDYAGAVKYASKSIELDPHHAEPFETLAKALDNLGRPSEAVQAFRDGFRFDPKAGKLLNDYILQLLRYDDAEHALPFARLNVELVPQAVSYSNLGVALAGLQDWRGARQALEAAIALDPRNYNAQCSLAAVSLQQRDRAAAVAHYKAAAAIDPADPRALHALEQIKAADAQLNFPLRSQP